MLDPEQRLLRSRSSGEPLHLTPKPFEALLILVKRRGEVVDKATLMQAIWPNVVVEENNLNQVISAIRKALGESATGHRFIHTVPGRGYRFVAPVTLRTEPAVMTAAPGSLSSEPAETRSPVPIARPTRHFPVFRIAFVVVLALTALAALWLVLRIVDEEPASSATTAVPEADAVQQTLLEKASVADRLRLAILPFENLSEDPANAFFTDGLHEEILSTLARMAPGLEVISRTTMMSYRLKPKPVHEVVTDLAATHVIAGTVRRAKDTVRLTLQLVDAHSDRLLWSQNYDRTLRSTLTLQSDVAAEVAAQLSVQLAGGTQDPGSPTVNPEAYDLYLKALVGRQYLSPFVPIERYREIEDLLTRAIAIDPSFASAYARRATLRGVMFAFNYDVSEAHLRRTREDVDAALRLAPEEPMALAAEAQYLSWIERELPRALNGYEAAEAARLEDSMSLAGKSALLLRMRRIDEAGRLNQRLMALDPGNPFIIGHVAATLALSRRPAEGLRMLERGLELFPDNPSLLLSRGQLVFIFTGRLDEWRTALDRADLETIPAALIEQCFSLLRLEHRYVELQELLDEFPEPTMRIIAGQAATALFGVGDRPIAEYRGWTALLVDDAEAAARHRRAVLDFVKHAQDMPRSSWYLRLLEASASVLLGEHGRAIAHAREAVDMMPISRDALTGAQVAYGAAVVYSWSGAQDDAVDVLEELVGGPAWITRDPLFAIPLAGNARYQELAARFEAQMQASGL